MLKLSHSSGMCFASYYIKYINLRKRYF